jgi:hypothetical protein
MKFWETENEVKIMNGVKVMSSYEPKDRPSYYKWIRQLKISHAAWYHDPDGRERADRIMENTGVEIKSTFEKIKSSLYE